MAGRIAFQGELGAYSHQACQQSRPDFEPVPSTTFEEVVDKVARGEVDLGMLAVENSTYGRVADVHSLVPRYYKKDNWVAYYDMYERPETLPPYAVGELSIWWYNAEKAEALKASGALK